MISLSTIRESIERTVLIILPAMVRFTSKGTNNDNVAVTAAATMSTGGSGGAGNGSTDQQQQQQQQTQQFNGDNNNNKMKTHQQQQQQQQQLPDQQQDNNRSSPTTAAARRRKKKQYAVSTQWEQSQLDNNINNNNINSTSSRDCHSRVCCCATRIGNMFALVSYRDGTPIVIAGPCWPFCIFVTLPLILSISFVVCYFLIIDNRLSVPDWVIAFYVPAVIFVLISLFCVSCRDPGLMERVTDEEAGEGGWFWNEQVGSYRPPGALYCRECGVLIQDYDHLCPWTGTGIGRKNMWAFKVFVVSVNMLCYFSVGILIWALLDGLAA